MHRLEETPRRGRTTRYVLTPLAEADLDLTWDYAAERFGFDVADRVLESLHTAFRLLAENPGIGHPREDIAPALAGLPRVRDLSADHCSHVSW